MSKIIELILSNLNEKNQVKSIEHLEYIYIIAKNDKLVFNALVYCGKNMRSIINDWIPVRFIIFFVRECEYYISIRGFIFYKRVCS